MMTITMKNWWRNRDVFLSLSLLCGLLAGNRAIWTQPLILPALAVAMTLSLTGVRRDILRSRQELWLPGDEAWEAAPLP